MFKNAKDSMKSLASNFKGVHQHKLPSEQVFIMLWMGRPERF